MVVVQVIRGVQGTVRRRATAIHGAERCRVVLAVQAGQVAVRGRVDQLEGAQARIFIGRVGGIGFDATDDRRAAGHRRKSLLSVLYWRRWSSACNTHCTP